MSSHLFAEASAHMLAVTPTAHWLEFLDFASAILAKPAEIVDGTVTARGPGLGLEWNESGGGEISGDVTVGIGRAQRNHQRSRCNRYARLLHRSTFSTRSRTRHRAAGTPPAAPPADLPRSGPGPPRARPRRASRRRCRRPRRPARLAPATPAIIPASTSPAPAVASQGGALEAMRGAAVRRRHHRIRPLQQHHGAGAFGGGPHPFQFRAAGMLVADIAEQARKLALMRRQHDLRIVRSP